MKKTIREKVSRRIIEVGIIMSAISIVLSYVLFVPRMEKEAVERADNTNMEIIRQIDSVISFVWDYTENLALSVAQNQEILRYFSEPQEQNKNIAALQLNNLISYEGIIRSVVISDGQVPALDSLNKITKEDKELLESEWYIQQANAPFGRALSGVYKVEINGEERYTVAYSKNFYHANKKYTYVIYVDLNNMIDDFQKLALSGLDYAALVDGQNQVFSIQANERMEKINGEDISYEQLKKVKEWKKGIGFVNTAVNGKWRLISYVENRTIFMTFSYYVIGIFIVLILFMLLTLLVLSKVIGNIIKPISILSEGMRQVAKGNLDCQVDIDSDDEIGLLGNTFNRMAKELKTSLEVISQKEKQEQQIKFSLLISQINPHFIYNTINSINYLARRGRCEDIIKVNSALIFILQDRLRVNSIEFTDTIENEKRVIEQYIVIERYMYDGDLKLVWQIEENLNQEQIPKNMLQPLVENALFHGLIDEESGELNGEIGIQIKKKEGNIVVKVTDNGMGMEEEQLNKIREELYGARERGKRIGLGNISQRLYYLYGSTDGIRIDSKKNEGTSITLVFGKNYFEQ